MKAVKVIKPNEIELVSMSMPVIENNDDVIIKVKSAGICGSDISIYTGTSPVATYPRVIGHEFAGQVIEIGSDVKDITKGDHVTVNPVCSCGECTVCKKQRSNVCSNLSVMGVHLDGGFCEYVKVPSKNVFVLDKKMPWEQAAIIEPYAVAAQVVDRGSIKANDKVLICGCGLIAMTILQVCNIIGAECIMSDILPYRLEQAKKYGAKHVINSNEENLIDAVKKITGGELVDVAIDAACVSETLKQAALCVRSAGVVVTLGFHDKIAQITEFNITSRELDIRGSRLNNNKFPQVIKWIEEGKLDNSKIITNKYEFTKIEDAINKFKNPDIGTMKIILNF